MKINGAEYITDIKNPDGSKYACPAKSFQCSIAKSLMYVAPNVPIKHAISRTVCIGQFFRVRIAVIAKSMWKPNKTNIHLLIKEEARGRGEETTHREEILL
mmetsp:Transcript_954/g.1497  ORF Transcript_954/g.1497 Transcript_954/m.1497 type:complete len:101 (-) Transcript_954:19-321(-)